MKRLLAIAASAVVCVGAASAAAVGAPGPAAQSGRSESHAPDLHGPLPHRRVPAVAGADLVGSENWSGYAQSAPAGTFTGVSATFVVTTVDTKMSGTQYSSDWVGVDGFNNGKLVQAGVEEDNFDGAAYYQAWTEVLPKSENPLTLTIAPGDLVTATVHEIADNRWVMMVSDDTTGKSAKRVVNYRAPGTSVEAIHERPCVIAGCNSVSDLADLATTSDEVFDPAQFTESRPRTSTVYQPLLVPTSGAILYDIVMLANNGSTPLATPSGPNAAGDGFAVADGSTTPPAPG